MLDGILPVKRHAFDLLFNLSIHANLYEDLAHQAIDTSNPEGWIQQKQTNKTKTKTKTKTKNLDVKKAYTAELIQEDLFQKLKEMIFYIFHKRFPESALWKSALNCLLFFVAAEGKLIRRRFFSFCFFLLFFFFQGIQPKQ